VLEQVFREDWGRVLPRSSGSSAISSWRRAAKTLQLERELRDQHEETMGETATFPDERLELIFCNASAATMRRAPPTHAHSS